MKLAYDVYEPFGDGSDRNPIVLLHSVMETKATWRPIGQPLADQTRRKVYALDLRNHGDSPRSDEYNIEVLVADLDEFLKDHSALKAVLIGHSLGGKIVIIFTLQNPESVESVVVEDVPVSIYRHRLPNLVPFAVRTVKQFNEDFRKIRDKVEAERRMRHLGNVFADFLVATPEMIEKYEIENLPAKWDGHVYQLDVNIDAIADAIQNNSLQKEVAGNYGGGALFLFGGASLFNADKDMTIEKFFPKANRVIIGAAGHFIHQTYPKEYLTEVVHFINKSAAITAKY